MKEYHIDKIFKSRWEKKMLDWYVNNKRDLPWRKTKDPYLVWVSEIILQQTRIETGIKYYHSFIKKCHGLFKLYHQRARVWCADA